MGESPFILVRSKKFSHPTRRPTGIINISLKTDDSDPIETDDDPPMERRKSVAFDENVEEMEIEKSEVEEDEDVKIDDDDEDEFGEKKETITEL